MATFVGPRDEALVDAAEAAVGVPFPPSYRRFVLAFGAGGVGPEVFYGVITADFTGSSVPNGIWVTLEERRYGLSDRVIVVGASGMGEWYVLDGRKDTPDGEFPLAVWPQGADITDDDELEVPAPDFGSFFLEKVRYAVER